MKVTAQWIAEQCGVSRGTVDRVVKRPTNVAPEVRERVQKIIKRIRLQNAVAAAGGPCGTRRVPHRRDSAELDAFHPPYARGHSRGCTRTAD